MAARTLLLSTRGFWGQKLWRGASSLLAFLPSKRATPRMYRQAPTRVRTRTPPRPRMCNEHHSRAPRCFESLKVFHSHVLFCVLHLVERGELCMAYTGLAVTTHSIHTMPRGAEQSGQLSTYARLPYGVALTQSKLLTNSGVLTFPTNVVLY